MSNLDAYLLRLSDLGREFGVGLTGEIQTYEMIAEDHWFDYSADADGAIRLGAQAPTMAAPAATPPTPEASPNFSKRRWRLGGLPIRFGRFRLCP